MKPFEFVIMTFLIILAFVGGAVFSMKVHRAIAIDANVAYYEVNRNTGETSFVWHTNMVDKIDK